MLTAEQLAKEYAPDRCVDLEIMILRLIEHHRVKAAAEEREACAAIVSEGVKWTTEPEPAARRYLAESFVKLARDIRARSNPSQ